MLMPLQNSTTERGQSENKGQSQNLMESWQLWGNQCLINAKMLFISIASSTVSAFHCQGFVQTESSGFQSVIIK